MALVRPVEAPVDQVVGVVAVGDRLVAASGTVRVPAVMALGRVGVPLGVRVRDRDRVLVDVIFVRVVQMALVEEVDVALVPYRRVPARLPVEVIVALVRPMFVLRHAFHGRREPGKPTASPLMDYTIRATLGHRGSG